jgi:hypothetical protein
VSFSLCWKIYESIVHHRQLSNKAFHLCFTAETHFYPTNGVDNCPPGIAPASGSQRHSKTERKNCRAHEDFLESHVDFGKRAVFSLPPFVCRCVPSPMCACLTRAVGVGPIVRRQPDSGQPGQRIQTQQVKVAITAGIIDRRLFPQWMDTQGANGNLQGWQWTTFPSGRSLRWRSLPAR